jgi:hypothetical protein
MVSVVFPGNFICLDRKITRSSLFFNCKRISKMIVSAKTAGDSYIVFIEYSWSIVIFPNVARWRWYHLSVCNKRITIGVGSIRCIRVDLWRVVSIEIHVVVLIVVFDFDEEINRPCDLIVNGDCECARWWRTCLLVIWLELSDIIVLRSKHNSSDE